jgi:TM2 domain-containing membrane protein YozV
MWLGVGVLLLIVWSVSFLVFKVAGWAIHILIAGAVIAGLLHLVRRLRNKRDS